MGLPVAWLRRHGASAAWSDSGVVTESRVAYVADYIPVSYGLSGSATSAATFTSTSAAGTTLTAASITNTPLIGDFIIGTNVKPGTYITNIAGTTYTLSQTTLGTLAGTYTCRRGVVWEFDSTAHPSGVYSGSYASGNNKWVRPDVSDNGTAGANNIVISKVYPETVATYTLTTSAHGITVDTTTSQLASSGTVVGNTSGVIARIVGVPSTTTLRVEAPTGSFTAAEVLTTRNCTGATIGNGTSTYSSISASLGYRNGVEYNPNSKTTTKLDFESASSPTSCTYSAQTDFLPNKTITVASGEIHSVLKARSYDYSKNRPALAYSSVLTVVYEGVTDSANKLRPQYYGATTAKDHISVGNLQYQTFTKLPSSASATLGVSGISNCSFSTVADWYTGCWSDHYEGQGGEAIRPMFSMCPQIAVSSVYGWDAYTGKTGVADASGYGCQISSSQTYGSVIQELMHNAALRFVMSDFDISDSTHKQALVNFLQAANDYRGNVIGGVTYGVDGGHLGGRKAILLNGEYYLDATNSGKFRAAIDAQEVTAATPFSEDAFTYYGHDGTTALYGSTGTDAQYWAMFYDTPTKKHYRDPYGLIDGGIDMFSSGTEVAYQGNVASGFINTCNWLRALSRTNKWTNGDTAKQAFIDYTDRYKVSGSKYTGDTAFPLQLSIAGTGTKTGTGYLVGDTIWQGSTQVNKIGTVVEVLSADNYRVETKDSLYYTSMFLGGTDIGTGTANGTGCATNNGTGTGHDTSYTTGSYNKVTYYSGGTKYYGDTKDNYAGGGGGRWPSATHTTIDYQSTYANNVDTWFTNYNATTPIIAAQSFSYLENQSTGATVATVVTSPNIYSSAYTYKFTLTGNQTSSDTYYSINATTGVITLTAAGAAAAANDYEAVGSPFTHNVTVTDGTNATSAAADMTLTVLDVLEGSAATVDATTLNTLGSGTSQSFNHTAAGSHTVAIVMCSHAGNDPSGVTYAGGAMTKLTLTNPANGSGNRVSVWYRTGSFSSGVNAVVVTHPFTVTAAAFVITAANADTVTPIYSSDSQASSTTSRGVTLNGHLGGIVAGVGRAQAAFTGSTVNGSAGTAIGAGVYDNGTHHSIGYYSTSIATPTMTAAITTGSSTPIVHAAILINKA